MEDRDHLLYHFRVMLRVRRFEERLLALFREGRLRGTAHVCLGQEAVAAGAAAALTDEDCITSNHRGHGHMLARGADPGRVMAEFFERETGYSLGRGGSQHIAALDIGFLGSNGITAGGLPVAVGAGLRLLLRGAPGVCLAFFGDGASAQGTFHESLNLAALWRLPVLFLCENNHYAMGTHVRDTCPVPSIAIRADGYGIPRRTVDGNDPLAVEDAVREARARAVAGEGPVFLEAVTWRATGHSRSDLCDYRDAGEEAQWAERDPLCRHLERMRAADIDSETISGVETAVAAEIDAAVDFASAGAFLSVERATEGVYPEPCVTTPPPGLDRLEAEERLPAQRSYAEALRLALARAMRDPDVVLMGEDIAAYRGAFRVTGDLAERFGTERVRDTPISENTIVGAGTGAALCGARPVVEIMFMDFLLLALDQIGNHAAKYSYIFGGQARVPLTIRTPAGGRRGYGATHSQCFESLLLSLPGLKVFTPSTPQDAYDLLLAAIFDDAPVAFVEQKLLYAAKDRVDPTAPPLPPGRARIVREGTDATLVTFGHMVSLALQAADLLQKQGVSLEVIDLRTLEPLDVDTIAESACRTQRLAVAEEGVRRGGVGAELAARLQEECFGYLDAPVLRIGAEACPVPTARHLEEAVLPGIETIGRTILRLLDVE